MRVLSYSVRNVMGCSEVDLDMDGANLFLIGGKNGQAKTSSIKAFLMALCGRRDMKWPDIALKEGQSEGWVKINLSGDDEMHEPEGFTVELLMKRKRGGIVAEEFRVLDSAGEEAPEPRALLKRLYQFRAFDPLAFERAAPKQRAEMLRDLLGLDFTALDAERKKIFDERTIVNREGKAKKAQLEAISFPNDTPDEPESVSDLFKQLEEAKTHNDRVTGAIKRLEKSLTDLNEEDERLDEEEKEIRERLKAIAARREAMGEARRESTDALETTRKRPLKNVDAIQERIRKADATNAAVAAKQRHEQIADELETLREESQEKTDRMHEIDQEKQNALEAAKWPMPNMSIDEDCVMLDGLPFDQAPKSKRVLTSVKMGMAMNPKLRLLVCEDGNDLDDDALQALDDVLKENDFQMILEYITRTELDEAKCAVVFHEGKPKKSRELETSKA